MRKSSVVFPCIFIALVCLPLVSISPLADVFLVVLGTLMMLLEISVMDGSNQSEESLEVRLTILTEWNDRYDAAILRGKDPVEAIAEADRRAQVTPEMLAPIQKDISGFWENSYASSLNSYLQHQLLQNEVKLNQFNNCRFEGSEYTRGIELRTGCRKYGP